MSTLYVDNLEPNLGSRVLAAGHVVQVVQGTTATQVQVSATSETDTGLTATITPSSTTSKILVMVDQSIWINDTSDGNAGGNLHLYRDSTKIITSVSQSDMRITAERTVGELRLGWHLNYNILDAPNSTSAIVYKTTLANFNAVYIDAQHSSSPSRIILMEIAQ